MDIAPDITELTKGNSFGTIEAVKTVSDMYAPVSGKVLELNSKLADEPQLVNSDPYGEGWIIKVELTDTSQLNDLLDVAAYKAQIGQ
jgi:glycine cleavage system H protein